MMEIFWVKLDVINMCKIYVIKKNHPLNNAYEFQEISLFPFVIETNLQILWIILITAF